MSLSRSFVRVMLASYMALIIGSIQLHKESIGIAEFERLLVAARFRLQIARLQPGDHFIVFEAFDSEIDVVEVRRGALLLDSKEALADAQDVRGCGMLLERHSKELLVKLRRALYVGHSHGHVIQA